MTPQPCVVGRAPGHLDGLPLSLTIEVRSAGLEDTADGETGVSGLAGHLPQSLLPCSGLGTRRGTERVAGLPNSFHLLIHKHFVDNLSSVLDPKYNVNQESYTPCLESGLAGGPDTNVWDGCRTDIRLQGAGGMKNTGGGPTSGAQRQPEGAASQEGRREQT